MQKACRTIQQIPETAAAFSSFLSFGDLVTIPDSVTILGDLVSDFGKLVTIPDLVTILEDLVSDFGKLVNIFHLEQVSWVCNPQPFFCQLKLVFFLARGPLKLPEIA